MNKNIPGKWWNQRKATKEVLISLVGGKLVFIFFVILVSHGWLFSCEEVCLYRVTHSKWNSAWVILKKLNDKPPSHQFRSRIGWTQCVVTQSCWNISIDNRFQLLRLTCKEIGPLQSFSFSGNFEIYPEKFADLHSLVSQQTYEWTEPSSFA